LFERHGIGCDLDSQSGDMIGVSGEEFESLCAKSDILITIGGDGTLISTVRKSFHHLKPVMGVHMGTLGFLTDIHHDEIESCITRLVQKDYRIDNRIMIKATLSTQTTQKTLYAFNDVVITRKQINKMVHLKASIDNEPFNTYYGDGLIIATPTGSTAYNISAGGPVIYPLSHTMIITPICAHSLTQRPVVLPAEFVIDLEVNDDEIATVIFDGQEIEELSPKGLLRITISKNYAKLIHRRDRNYFHILREKFRWGDL
jgi:NAD+ kinase